MKVQWTSKALSDLSRLFEFLASVNRSAAANVISKLTKAADTIYTHPRIGEILDSYQPREVRRLIVNDYEMRYEIASATIFMLRIWHTR